MDGAAQTLHRLGVGWPELIGQLICFAIIFVFLKMFAFKPILALLQQRQQRITEAITNADKIKDELAKTEAARREVLDKTAAQANQIIEEARTAAARVLETESQKAIATAEQIITKAREAAEADHARMLAELKREVGRLVVETTARVSGKVLTLNDQSRLIEETNKQVAA